MFVDKYFKSFAKNNKDAGTSFYNTIKSAEKKCNNELINWTENDIKIFLIEIHATSPSTLNKYLVILRQFIDYICEKENLPKVEFGLNYSESNLVDYIDYDLLLKVTLSYHEYQHIKNQLDKNIRDKVMFELAWQGLTNDQIRNLRKTDIQYVYNDEYGWDIAFLNIGKEMPLKIEDPEVVSDIKECEKEQYYYSEAKDGRNKRYVMKGGDFLIRPVNVGKGKKEEYIANPSLSLQGIFRTQDIKCHGIDIEFLSIEDIRRSKLIYLLSNKEYFDMDFLMVIYGFKNDSGLYWLKRIANIKYQQ
jgi:hypothetical protein